MNNNENWIKKHLNVINDTSNIFGKKYLSPLSQQSSTFSRSTTSNYLIQRKRTYIVKIANKIKKTKQSLSCFVTDVDWFRSTWSALWDPYLCGSIYIISYAPIIFLVVINMLINVILLIIVSLLCCCTLPSCTILSWNPSD